jgi:biopolymer transport protein ExbB
MVVCEPSDRADMTVREAVACQYHPRPVCCCEPLVFELLKVGGYVMFPLLAASVLAIGIVLERFWTLRRSAVLPPGLGEEVRAWARSPKLDPAHLKKLQTNSPLGEVLAEILLHRGRSREVMRQKAEEAGRQVVHQLGRFLNALGTIATISPLLGLLGTVIGLIRMFLVITTDGIGDANKLAGGIGEALVATASGLVVAIFAFFFHRLLRGIVLSLGVALEREAVMLIDSLERPVSESPAANPTVRAVR